MQQCQVTETLPFPGAVGQGSKSLAVFVGALVHATGAHPLLVVPDQVLGVQGGKIKFVKGKDELDKLIAEHGFTESDICYLTDSQFLMPGLIDTHIHACQFSNNGLALDLPLLEWLNTYTFPTEARFSDTVYARNVYNTAVERLLRNGTTTAAYWATTHLEASKILVDVVAAQGQRAIIGKVNMLRNCPDYYREPSLEASLRDTEDFLIYVRDLKSPLIAAAVTPRFAPTCPAEQLEALAELAARFSCRVQTHLSETRAECAWVRQLFPGTENYTDVYHASGLLGNKTILAHVVWPESCELDRVKEAGAGVAHCPASNVALLSGHCNVRALLTKGIKVGLGTDCSGGYAPSILDALRRCVDVSHSVSFTRAAGGEEAGEVYTPLTHKEAFRLATLGGAQVLGLADQVGSLEEGKQFDALLVDVSAPGSPLDVFPEDSMEALVDRFLHNGDDRNIVCVYVAGRPVAGSGHAHLGAS